MINSYYEKYWKKEIKGASQDKPPVWEKENLNWHYDFFKKYIGKKIIDIGAGDGTFSNFIYKKNKKNKVDALEISKTAIKIGQKKHKFINFIQKNIEKFSPTIKYDTVFTIEVLEHILDIDSCLENIYKITNKNGYLCITTTDFNLLKKILISAFCWEKYFYPNNPHIRFFTKKSLIQICQKHNFTFVDYKWNKSYFGLMPKGQMIVFQKQR